jgi:NAD(P)-dependent dehydrogenase (short-subunit alcohol dehydrogenase family)
MGPGLLAGTGFAIRRIPMKLEGQVAVVTGAGRGLGRAYALRLARLGANVVVNDIDLGSASEFGEELTAEGVDAEIRALGRRSLAIEADVREKAAVDSMFEQVVAEFGRIDILVANAGGLAGDRTKSYASSVPEDELRHTFDRNLMGTIFSCQAALVPMKQQSYGRIVTVSSQAGLRGAANGYYASYGAAKAAIVSYTQYLAGELAPHGINVNCIAPAYINTGRIATWSGWDDEDNLRKTLEQVPMDRLGEVEDCANVVEFFVTDLSGYVTGQTLSICGGAIRFR